MKFMKKVTAFIIAILGIVFAAVGIVTKHKEAASIGIIGGADGPTAIFVAGRIGNGFSIAAILIGLVLVIAGVVIWKRFKK